MAERSGREYFLVEGSSLGMRLARRGHLLTARWMDEDWPARKVFLRVS